MHRKELFISSFLVLQNFFGFKNMPELEHGYPFVIVGSLIIVAVIIWIFKKKKIM